MWGIMWPVTANCIHQKNIFSAHQVSNLGRFAKGTVNLGGKGYLVPKSIDQDQSCASRKTFVGMLKLRWRQNLLSLIASAKG